MVWDGYDNVLKRWVAVKIYQKDALMEPARWKGVNREIKLLERMNHPNIMKVTDTFETDDEVLIVSELIGGDSLIGLLKSQGSSNRKLWECEAWPIMWQIA